MEKIFLLSFIIMLSVNLFAQRDEYPSREEDEYYKNLERHYIPFKQLDMEFILGFKSEYYEIHEAESNYEPYSPNKYLTPYQDSIRKIDNSIYAKISSITTPIYRYSKELPNSIEKIINGLSESLSYRNLEYIEKI